MVWAQYRKVYGTSLEVKVLDVAAETLLYCLWNSPLHRRYVSALAEKIGLKTQAQMPFYDLIIIGA